MNNKVLVIDVAASGATGVGSVLSDFYMEVCNASSIGLTEYIFVLSLPELEEKENVKVLRYPWVKKNWFYRLFFDYFVAPKLIKKYGIDKIVSLQNTPVSFVKTPQCAVVDKAIAFFDYPVSLFKEPKLWVQKNIIGKKLIKSIKKLDKVIVQGESFKKLVAQKANIPLDNISVILPIPMEKVNIDKYYTSQKNRDVHFFYPASALSYKNHKLVVEACKILKKDESLPPFKIIFTQKGDESEAVKKAFYETHKYNLPIDFIGSISREEVFALYRTSILIFPSLVEAGAFPLNEAKLFNCPILAGDIGFSHDFIDDYPNGYYFDLSSSSNLAEEMKKFIMGEITYEEHKSEYIRKNTLYDEVITFLQ